jgi:hypothetical protein
MPSKLEGVANDFVAALDSKDIDRIVESTTEDAQGVDEIPRRWLRDRSERESESYLRQSRSRGHGFVVERRPALRPRRADVWTTRVVSPPDALAIDVFARILAEDLPLFDRSVAVFSQYTHREVRFVHGGLSLRPARATRFERFLSAEIHLRLAA